MSPSPSQAPPGQRRDQHDQCGKQQRHLFHRPAGIQRHADQDRGQRGGKKSSPTDPARGSRPGARCRRVQARSCPSGYWPARCSVRPGPDTAVPTRVHRSAPGPVAPTRVAAGARAGAEHQTPAGGPQHHPRDHDRQCDPINQMSGHHQQQRAAKRRRRIGQSQFAMRQPKARPPFATEQREHKGLPKGRAGASG